jgi:hypothetical protein
MVYYFTSIADYSYAKPTKHYILILELTFLLQLATSFTWLIRVSLGNLQLQASMRELAGNRQQTKREAYGKYCRGVELVRERESDMIEGKWLEKKDAVGSNGWAER